MTKDKAREYMATVIVAFISDVTGERLDTLGNLIFIAQALGCYVDFFCNGVPSYAPTRGHFEPEGQIVFNSDENDEAIRQVVHEVVHHILWWWHWWGIKVPDTVTDALDRSDEEMICRAVTDLVKALPSGLQWNGKLAAPRGTRCRIYRRLPCRLSCPIPVEEWPEWAGRLRDINVEREATDENRRAEKLCTFDFSAFRTYFPVLAAPE